MKSSLPPPLNVNHLRRRAQLDNLANFPARVLYCGENLDFLKAMNSNCVDLIATDPPFKKSKDFHADPDLLEHDAKFEGRWKWEESMDDGWVDQIEDEHPVLMRFIDATKIAHSHSMGAFMCFISVRLLEMKRILKNTGSIYLHCDSTVSHYVKACMDAIFGRKNFRNEIVWCYDTPSSAKAHFPRKTDSILWFSKSNKYVFNSDSVRIPYKIEKLGRKGWGTISKYSNEKIEKGKIMPNWWADIASAQRLVEEGVKYPTQKPIALYKRIIATSSNKGDMVLDPFCGCATTLVAAEQLERKWVGIDIWDKANEIVKDRMKNANLAVDGKAGEGMLSFDDVVFTKELPTRTDRGENVSPKLRPTWIKGQEFRMRHEDMVKSLQEFLKEICGKKVVCPGCGHKLPSMLYFHLDHVTPRSGGGSNNIGNRILLCSLCNTTKFNSKTMPGLIQYNKKNGRFPPKSLDGYSARERASYLNSIVAKIMEKTRIKEEEERDKWLSNQKSASAAVQPPLT